MKQQYNDSDNFTGWCLEGFSEEDQICRQLNFDCAQGYYYGKPAQRENF